ncbi:MAG: hypothetical protein BRD49_00075 [Bacteroidetes bacterium SW_10_40_5]|nr:MAG: hypothetical protein BRD49_00075 [Bacteroidetes bacterium SW_10_40_5]
MPEYACQYFYECENCHEVLKPKYSDCCVFCSYGNINCPPCAGEWEKPLLKSLFKSSSIFH